MKGPNADNAGSGYAVIYLFIYIEFAGFSGEHLAELTASQLSRGYQARKPVSSVQQQNYRSANGHLDVEPL